MTDDIIAPELESFAGKKAEPTPELPSNEPELESFAGKKAEPMPSDVVAPELESFAGRKTEPMPELPSNEQPIFSVSLNFKTFHYHFSNIFPHKLKKLKKFWKYFQLFDSSTDVVIYMLKN